jgi:diguanylate cyclase (GGDEF)-like protein
VLTGLPNRAMFHDRLDHAMMQARRNNRLVALLFLDLDNFKLVNDTLGHAAGDGLLDEVAGRLKDCVREADTVARLGGDEFAVILESVSNASAVATAANVLIDCVARTYRLEGQDVRVTASIGITLFPDDADNRTTLCRNADTAMYRAKELGRNNFQFFTADLTARATERMAMESRLRNALANNEFAIYYQPKLNLSTGSVMGMEALLRWHNPDLGQISPEVFIPILESTGHIIEVGDWVLESACHFTQGLRARGHQVDIAINLSARQVADADLPDRIRKFLAATNLPAAALELEITETLLIENLSVAVAALTEMNAIGVRVAIDDFGTGYSSLAYLKRLPIDTLKIDRTFVRDLPADAEDVAITTAIVALAHSLKLEIVAEGIETADQAEFLATLGCAFGQGYWFSRPLPPLEFAAWLERTPASRDAVPPAPTFIRPPVLSPATPDCAGS